MSNEVAITPSWERLAGESPSAYVAFAAYRDLGPGRTIAAAWEVLKGGGRQTPPRRWWHWSSGFHWVTRAAAYDAHLDGIRRQAAEDAAREEAAEFERRRLGWKDREYSVGLAMLDRVERMLQMSLTRQIVRDGKAVIEPVRWTMGDVARLMLAASKVGRMSLGLVTDRTEVDEAGATAADGFFGNLTDAELAQIRAALDEPTSSNSEEGCKV